jgi:intracellular septation protein
MMTEKMISPKLKAALEFGPILLFFAGYFLLRGQTFHILGAERSGFVLMTLIFVPVLVVTTLLLWRLAGEISAMQILTLVMVVALGGLTIWLNDETFFKMKPTLVYLIFAGILGAGLLRGRSYLELAIGKHLPMKAEGWMILTKRMLAAFLVMALANEVVWRTMSTEVWVTFKTFGLSALLIAFFMTQAKLISTYAEDENKDGKP